MTDKADRFDEMMRGITRAIVLDTGTRESMAVEYARSVMRYLQQERAANGALYVPNAPRQLDLLQIRAALERGDSPRQVAAQFSISRRQLFRLFPGGLPARRSA